VGNIPGEDVVTIETAKGGEDVGYISGLTTTGVSEGDTDSTDTSDGLLGEENNFGPRVTTRMAS
jgi:hypothetical protein